MDKLIFQIGYKWFRNHISVTYFQLQINFIPIFDFESRFMFLSGTIKLLLFSNLCKMYYLFSKVISSFQLNKKTLVGVSNLVFNETAKLSSYFHFCHMRHSMSYSIYWDFNDFILESRLFLSLAISNTFMDFCICPSLVI